MNISPETWDRLSSLFDEALDLPPDDRAAWLTALSETQPGLAPTLGKLLEAHDSSGSTDRLGSSPALALAPDLQPNRVQAGDRVGPYCLLRPLGSGGMADVWLADRVDGAFAREVALKLPLVSWLRRDLSVRFARERDILARLEHTNIARFYDAGVSADGLPYLAMEYVDGQPITAWCDSNRLDVPGRVRLFAQVLAAVQFAHANLVIHRDLKPSNVLVTGDGEVRLLDFGIAKLLAADEEQVPETQLTRWTGRALTPEYASPEQIKGEALTIGSDIYSLGVVLFELLVGVRPYRLKVDSLAQLEEAIVDSDPLRPSASVTGVAGAARGVSASRLTRQLAGDLDTVVLKTLAKSPAARYPTALALAEDLERHLEGLPVQAQRASLRYRVWKFVGRHRWPVGASAATIALLLTAAAVAFTQGRRAMKQEQVAVAEAQKATAVKDFVIEMINLADPSGASDKPPGEITLQEAVDGAAARIGPALEGQPEAKMAVLDALSSIYQSLDQSERSAALLQEALALSEQHDGIPHPNQALFLVESANIALWAGRHDESRRWLDKSEPVFRALGDSTSLSFAQALKLKGALARHGANADFQRAVELLEQSATLFRARYPQDEGRVGVLFYLAQTLRSVDALDRALVVTDEAVQLAALSKKPGLALPGARSLRAAIRANNGDLRGADIDFAAAAAEYGKSAGPTHFLTLQNAGLHGMTLLEMGQRDRGLKMVEDSTAALAKVRTGSATHATAVERLGAAHLLVGNFARALSALEEARGLWDRRHDDLARTGATVKLTTAYAAVGRYQEVGSLLEEALVHRGRAHDSQWPVAEVHLTGGLLALDHGEEARARSELDRAVSLSPAKTRGDLTRRALAQTGVVRLAELAGNAEEALVAADQAVALAESSLLSQLPGIGAAALEAKGTTLCRFGRAPEGEPLLARVVSLRTRLLDPTSPLLARTQLVHAGCLLQLGHTAEARTLARSAAAILTADAGGSPFERALLRTVQSGLH